MLRLAFTHSGILCNLNSKSYGISPVFSTINSVLHISPGTVSNWQSMLFSSKLPPDLGTIFTLWIAKNASSGAAVLHILISKNTLPLTKRGDCI